MKAKELIAILETVDPEATVLLWEEIEDDDAELAWCSQISHVKVAAAFKHEAEEFNFDISHFAPTDRPDVVPVVILHHAEIPDHGELLPGSTPSMFSTGKPTRTIDHQEQIAPGPVRISR